MKSALIAVLALATAVASAQSYPSRPIRMLIPAAPGGGVDTVGRILAIKLSASLGQQVVPENKAGAGTMLASEMLAQSPPDGYTILMATSSHTVNAAVRTHLRYDPIADFAPVALVGSTPDLLVVNPKSPYHTLGELVAAAKKNPKKITYGSSGPGTVSQLEGEQLKFLGGIDLLHVPYKGGIPAVTALIGGEIDSLFLGVVGLGPQVKAGKLRAIAYTGTKRSPLFPDVPTMAESGFPGWDTGIWYGAVVPAKTPPEIVALLNKHIVEALKSPDVRQKLAAIGIDPIGSTPAQFSTVMKNDIARWKKLVERDPKLKSDD